MRGGAGSLFTMDNAKRLAALSRQYGVADKMAASSNPYLSMAGKAGKFLGGRRPRRSRR